MEDNQLDAVNNLPDDVRASLLSAFPDLVIPTINTSSATNIEQMNSASEPIDVTYEEVTDALESFNVIVNTTSEEELEEPPLVPVNRIEPSARTIPEILAEAEDIFTNLTPTAAPVEEITSSALVQEELNIGDATSRFRGADWFTKMNSTAIHLIGCGGIGSWTGLLLSRLGLREIYLQDFDSFEEGNLSGQFVDRAGINLNKALYLKSQLNRYSTNSIIYTIGSRFNSGSYLSSNIIVCGLDSMAARKNVFATFCNHTNRNNMIFIDGRLAAEEFQIFAIQGSNSAQLKLYQNNYMFKDSEADEVRCSYKQTSYAAAMIASFITNIIVNHVSNISKNVVIPRPVPFLTEFNCLTMDLNIMM